jgi:hypothetical protein
MIRIEHFKCAVELSLVWVVQLPLYPLLLLR